MSRTERNSAAVTWPGDRERELPHGISETRRITGGRRLAAWVTCWLLGAVLCRVQLAAQTTHVNDAFDPHPTVILVVGAPGEAEFGSNFLHQVELWQKACGRAKAQTITLGLEETAETNDWGRVRETLNREPKGGLGPLWLILIGHGTFDGKEAWFNLRGPDLSASDLALWLEPYSRPLVVINTASSSAPFLNKLSGTNRVIITATRSGHEQNFTRLGQFLAQAINQPEADLDKDGQVSLLEAFLTASRQTVEFYKLQGRLVTEHALLDDNGDGLGTPADWFRGLRAFKKPQENTTVDGLHARQFGLVPSKEELNLTPEQRARRDELERAVLLLRVKKGQIPEEEYYQQLEKLLLDLARCYTPPS